MPDARRFGPGADLFDFLADCIHQFVHDNNVDKAEIPLGFTFSFPMRQTRLDGGILVSWGGKSFSCPDVEGTDAAEQLEKAIRRHQGKLKVKNAH